MAEQKYGVWDIKQNSFVRNKEYDSVSKANAASNRLDTTYGGSRYVPKLIPGSLPQKTSDAKDAQDEGTITAKRGGKLTSASKRGDGIATKGKTRGKML